MTRLPLLALAMVCLVVTACAATAASGAPGASVVGTQAPTQAGGSASAAATASPTTAATVPASTSVGSVHLEFSGDASLIVQGSEITCSCPSGGGPCDMAVTGDQYPDVGTGFYVSHGDKISTVKWIGKGKGGLWVAPGDGQIQWYDDKHLALILRGPIEVHGTMGCA